MFCCQCRLEVTDDVAFSLPWTEKLLVCLLDQRRVLSDVSAWDYCDIGSGVHSKVNLFAVDLDVIMGYYSGLTDQLWVIIVLILTLFSLESRFTF